MNKRIVGAVAAVFVAWAIMDFIIHGFLLQAAYEATAQLWRPMEEFNMGLMYAVTLVCAAAFTLIYARLLSPKSIGSGVVYGLLFGVAVGVSAGFGSYSVMPIPLSLAWGWFLGTVAEAVVAGAIVGTIVKA